MCDALGAAQGEQPCLANIPPPCVAQDHEPYTMNREIELGWDRFASFGID